MRFVRFAVPVFALLMLAVMPRPTDAGSPMTYVVDTVDDVDLHACDQPDDDCSLRGAINNANTTPFLDTIEFDDGMASYEFVPGAIDGVPLPDITQPVFLDGSTGSVDRIYINGFTANLFSDGLRLVDHEGSTIKSVRIGGFNGDGIELNGGGGHQILDSTIGVNGDGTGKFVNNGHGVEIAGSNNNLIGSEDLFPANIISGNTLNGVHMDPSASGNRVIANYIGLNASGSAAIPNGSSGVNSEGLDNQIGEPGYGNIISGNQGDGVDVQRDGNVVQANRIGTTSDGASALGNSQYGITLYLGEGVLVGGEADAERNVISGNVLGGVKVLAGTSHRIVGNYIGTNAAGTSAIANLGGGILVTGFSEDIQIGEAGAGNLISGNFPYGVQIDDGSFGNDIAGNTFGLGANQSTGMPNYSWSLRIQGHANVVGGNTAGHRNVFGGEHMYTHIQIDGIGAYENSVLNNYIGTDGAGMIPYGTPNGISIYDGAGANFIGSPGLGNVISGNAHFGVQVRASDSNSVEDNLIGVAANGTTPLGNAIAGIGIGDPGTVGMGMDANTNHVGAAEAGNTIANNGAGIVVYEGVSNRFSQNSIYANPGGAIDLAPLGPDGIDELDADTGANNQQNPPQILSVTSGSTHIEGIVQSNPNAEFLVEVFHSPECNQSGFIDARTYLGFAKVVTDDEGVSLFEADFAATAPEGSWITATVSQNRNTSELSNCFETQFTPATPTPTPIATATPTPEPSDTPEPSETPEPTPTGTPSGKAVQGDTDCDEDADTVDGLFVLRDVAGFPPSKCIDNGDVDCDEDRDSVDALGILRHVAALPPLVQQEPCADIGQPQEN